MLIMGARRYPVLALTYARLEAFKRACAAQEVAPAIRLRPYVFGEDELDSGKEPKIGLIVNSRLVGPFFETSFSHHELAEHFRRRIREAEGVPVRLSCTEDRLLRVELDAADVLRIGAFQDTGGGRDLLADCKVSLRMVAVS